MRRRVRAKLDPDGGIATTLSPSYGPADRLTTRLKPNPLIIALCVLGLGCAAGLASELVIFHPEIGLTILLFAAAGSPIVIRLIQRRFDPFEPIQILAVTLLILYAVRPAAELVFGITSFDNQYIRSGFAGAAVISLVGILALYAGYAVSSGKRLARRTPAVPDMWDPVRSVRFGIWVLVVAALLTAAFAASVGPSAVFHLFLGRSQTSYTTFLAVSGYVGLGPYLTIPAAVIFLYAFMRLRSLPVFLLFAFSLAGAVFVSFPAGNRTYILALVLPLLVIPYLRKRRRPSPAATMLAVLAAVLGMNVFLATRRVAVRKPLFPTIAHAVTHLPSQLKDFATGVDLAEFSVLELEHQAFVENTNPLRFQPGQTLLSLVTYPLPRKLVGSKPPAAGQEVINRLFPTTTMVRASFNPALFGDFWADDGWLTIVLYCFVIGVAVRYFWEYFLRNVSSEGMQIVFAETLPILVIMVRNSAVDALARSLFLSGPLLLCLLVCSRPRMRRLAGWRMLPALRSQGDPALDTGLIGRGPEHTRDSPA
jgi:hypothetical protein